MPPVDLKPGKGSSRRQKSMHGGCGHFLEASLVANVPAYPQNETDVEVPLILDRKESLQRRETCLEIGVVQTNETRSRECDFKSPYVVTRNAHAAQDIAIKAASD
jgi:hypothetical protein